MKDENEIKRRIEQLKSEIDIGRVVSGKWPDTAKNEKVQALEWVLGNDD